MKGPILKGPRVTFRPIQLSDAPNYVRWFGDKEVRKYLAVKPVTLAQERKWIRTKGWSKTELNWAMEVNGKHIGGVGLRLDKDNKIAHWGIVIGDKSAWNNGNGFEAGKLCKDFVFKKLKYNRLELLVFISNKRALHVYKKLGFKLEGIKRECNFNGVTKKYEDDGMMSILRGEWLSR